MRRFWIIAILVAGSAYLLVLQWLIPDGSYFSGDSGLNAMLSQNLAAGNFGFNLQFPDQPWIKALWVEGMFPYGEPYVYLLAGKYYITFPYTFPLVTAPFYALFGYRGLYVIPVLATLLTWLVFYWACRKMNLGRAAAVTGTAFLIFAANLSIYSATYLEHTLSVGLSFAGLALAFPPKDAKTISFRAALWAGILTGLAVWFRPEQIFMVIFLDLLSLWALSRPLWSLRSIKFPDFARIPGYIGRFGWVYLLTSSLTLLTYGLTNLVIYQNFFGVHAIQVMEYQPLRDRILAALGNFQAMTIGPVSLFVTFPIAVFPLVYLCLSWIKPAQLKFEWEWAIWYAFCLAFMTGVSVLVPAGAGGKQWGPRFLLLLEPVIALLFTWQLDRLLKNWENPNQRSRWVGLGLVSILGVIGIIQNPFGGADFLSSTYAQIAPAVRNLRAESEAVIGISDPFIGQVLQPALSRDEVFLLVQDENRLARLSEAVFATGQPAFTYICYPADCKLFNPQEKTNQVARKGKVYNLQTISSGDYGKYTIFNVQVSLSN